MSDITTIREKARALHERLYRLADEAQNLAHGILAETYYSAELRDDLDDLAPDAEPAVQVSGQFSARVETPQAERTAGFAGAPSGQAVQARWEKK